MAADDPRLPAILLMGPTAAGKTDLAIALAKHLDCELISVDSALVYRGMDIGTAKPSPAVLDQYPHHLIDIRDPAEPYSAAEFRADALAAMEQARQAGRIPLLVGGTMLYFRALLHGLADMPAADPALRRQLAERFDKEGVEVMHAELARVDPMAAARIHPRNRQRIQRALEVYQLSGRSMSSLQAAMPAVEFPWRAVQIAVTPVPREVLQQRIVTRFHAMLDEGLVEEVRLLFCRGDLAADLPALRAVGYRQVWQYLAGECSYAEMIERGIAATRQLAKRQLTWLRSWHGLRWLHTDAEGMPLDHAGQRVGRSGCGEDLCNFLLKLLADAGI